MIDGLSLQTRMMIVMLGGVFSVVMIIVTLVKYTLVDHGFYKNLADTQQLREVELSVNRGTIYGTLDPRRMVSAGVMGSTILATTSVAQDLKIDPSSTCNSDLLEDFLVQIVYEHLCVGRSQVSCFDNILKYTNVYTTPENFNFTRESIEAFLRPTVHEQVNRRFKTRILLAQGLSTPVINSVLSFNYPGLSFLGDALYIDPTRFDTSRDVGSLLSLLGIDQAFLDDALELRKNRNVDIVEKLDTKLALRVIDTINQQSRLAREQPRKDQESYVLNTTFYKCIKLIDHPVRQYPE